MKVIRFIVPVMLLAVSSAAYSLDQDMEALMARLAAQEARMASQDARINDLNAKLASGKGSMDVGAVEGVLSLRKNAVVTIGGVLNTRYKYHSAKVDSDVDTGGNTVPYGRVADARIGNFHIADANVQVKIDVNDYFDAYVDIDLHGNESEYGNAKVYWVRWKNICQSGFGLKVGRDAMVFGTGGVGVLGSYAAGGGDGLGGLDFGLLANPILPHNGWDRSGILQATPYWEGLDGKVKLELSLMQNTWNDGNYINGMESGTQYDSPYTRSRNYGFGTASLRAVVEPIEGLKLSGSVINFRSNGRDDYAYAPSAWFANFDHTKNNTAIAVGINYRPAFLSRLEVWGQWVRGWNVSNMNGVDSDAINYGVSYDLTEALTVFAQGDYLNVRGDGVNAYRLRGKALAWYGGIAYSLGYGVTLEAGWKHERADYHANGGGLGARNGRVKATSDTIYGHLGFEF